MIEIKAKEDCCGCYACYNICPKECIIMESDNEGFWYPKIDKDKCINCNLCEKVCPIINKPNSSLYEKNHLQYLIKMKKLEQNMSLIIMEMFTVLYLMKILM